MLEEDVARFDTFLQANDARAHKAMKTAEDMTKKKQERNMRIKQLKAQISAVQSEISKHKEQKDECETYKNFLDKLTPQEWKDKKAMEAQMRKDERKQKWVDDRVREEQSK